MKSGPGGFPETEREQVDLAHFACPSFMKKSPVDIHTYIVQLFPKCRRLAPYIAREVTDLLKTRQYNQVESRSTVKHGPETLSCCIDCPA